MAKTSQQYLVSAARRIWRWSPERRLVKSDYKRSLKGSKGQPIYDCALCSNHVHKIHIDHIEPVGKAPKAWKGWDKYLQRLFCPATNLQALCVPCHKLKTQKDNAKI